MCIVCTGEKPHIKKSKKTKRAVRVGAPCPYCGRGSSVKLETKENIKRHVNHAKPLTLKSTKRIEDLTFLNKLCMFR